MSTNIEVHNKGKMYTYDCKLGKNIIDVTMSINLKLTVESWRVCKIYNGSDHHSITYELNTDIQKIPPHRPYHKAEWDILTLELQNMDIYIPDVITEEKLDNMVRKLNACIEKALDKACPMLPAKIVNKNNDSAIA